MVSGSGTAVWVLGRSRMQKSENNDKCRKNSGHQKNSKNAEKQGCLFPHSPIILAHKASPWRRLITGSPYSSCTSRFMSTRACINTLPRLTWCQDMAHFTVELLDYYSHVAVAESSASCHVAATPSALTKAVPPSLRGMGSSEAVVGGVANFSRVQLTGGRSTHAFAYVCHVLKKQNNRQRSH